MNSIFYIKILEDPNLLQNNLSYNALVLYYTLSMTFIVGYNDSHKYLNY